MVMRPSNGPGTQSVRINRYESVPGGFALLLSLYYRAPHVAGVKSECGGRPVMREDLALAPPASLLADRTQGHGWTNPLADLHAAVRDLCNRWYAPHGGGQGDDLRSLASGQRTSHNGAAESKFC